MKTFKFFGLILLVIAKKKNKNDDTCHEFCKCNSEKKVVACNGQGRG